MSTTYAERMRYMCLRELQELEAAIDARLAKIEEDKHRIMVLRNGIRTLEEDIRDERAASVENVA